LIFLFIALPLVVAGILPLVGKISPRLLPDILANAVFAALLAIALLAGPSLIGQGAGLQPLVFLGEPLGIHLALDGFSLFMLTAISLVGLCIGLFSVNYMEHYGHKAAYYALLLIMLAGMNGLVLVTDLFQVYLFLEVAAIASYALVAYGLGHEELEASFKYLMLSAVSSALIVVSVTLLFGLTGSLEFGAVSQALRSLDQPLAAGLCAALFIMGFGLKAALIPFHAWLPDAHPSAPAPISAALSGLLIKVSGIYALTRIFLKVFGLTPALSNILMILGAVSMVVAAFLALGQKDIKRMLAYSSISQVGYIVLGIGLGTPLGILGGLFHLLNHALAKSLLFLNSGSIQMAAGTRNLEEMNGLSKKMPVTAATTLVGSLSIAGVPPLNGFWSKLIIVMALVQAKRFGFALAAILASVLTLWYYLIIQRRAFFNKPDEKWRDVREAPFLMTTATVVLALLCIVIGIFFTATISTWIEPARDALAGGLQVIQSSIGIQ